MSMQVDAAAIGRATMPPIGSHRRRRGPRIEEIALMRDLADGPRAMTEGPIGRCVKRGWCRAVIVAASDGVRRGPPVLFALTDAGRALLAEA